MISPLQFFNLHVGRFIEADADPVDLLMRSYEHSDPDRKVRTRMGGSEPARFLISEEASRIWAPIRLPEHIVEEHSEIVVAPTSSRRRREWIVDIIMNPPKPPFLSASLGMSSNDLGFWKMTISESMLLFGGNATTLEGDNTAAIDRSRFLESVEWFRETQAPVSDVLRARDTKARFRRGSITGQQARDMIARIKTDKAVLDSYPGAENPFQTKLAAFAANEWTAQ